MIFVLAGNRREFLHFLAEELYGPNNHKFQQFTFVPSMDHCREVRGAELIILDGAKHNPAYDNELFALLYLALDDLHKPLLDAFLQNKGRER